MTFRRPLVPPLCRWGHMCMDAYRGIGQLVVANSVGDCGTGMRQLPLGGLHSENRPTGEGAWVSGARPLHNGRCMTGLQKVTGGRRRMRDTTGVQCSLVVHGVSFHWLQSLVESCLGLNGSRWVLGG